MVVLALDTALHHAQAALVDTASGAVLGASGAPAAGDAESIVAHADAALAAAGLSWADCRRIAVTVGPGSFTGVRVGIAYARGLAFALSVPAVGVSTLAVLARQAGVPVLAAVDARHGAVFAGLFPDGSGEADLTGRMPAGEALSLARQAGARIAGPPSAVAALGEGHTVARLDPCAIAAAGCAADPAVPPRALYLAPVDAAPQRHKAFARA
jgi:tRNA threonylcarbamoyladenosine biosynthesis protein TsaB